MGNNQRPEQSIILSSQNIQDWVKVQDQGFCELWMHKQTHKQLQAYPIPEAFARSKDQLQKYNFRRAHSAHLVSIEAIFTPGDNLFCSQPRTAFALVQNITSRLSQHRKQLSFQQALYVLSSSASGYNTLNSFFGPLQPRQEMICFNEEGEAKVWLNENLSLNEPSLSAKSLSQPSEDYSIAQRRTKECVAQLITIVENSSREPFNSHFTDECNHVSTYFELANMIAYYSEANGINLPDRVVFQQQRFQNPPTRNMQKQQSYKSLQGSSLQISRVKPVVFRSSQVQPPSFKNIPFNTHPQPVPAQHIPIQNLNSRISQTSSNTPKISFQIRSTLPAQLQPLQFQAAPLSPLVKVNRPALANTNSAPRGHSIRIVTNPQFTLVPQMNRTQPVMQEIIRVPKATPTVNINIKNAEIQKPDEVSVKILQQPSSNELNSQRSVVDQLQPEAINNLQKKFDANVIEEIPIQKKTAVFFEQKPILSEVLKEQEPLVNNTVYHATQTVQTVHKTEVVEITPSETKAITKQSQPRQSAQTEQHTLIQKLRQNYDESPSYTQPQQFVLHQQSSLNSSPHQIEIKEPEIQIKNQKPKITPLTKLIFRESGSEKTHHQQQKSQTQEYKYHHQQSNNNTSYQQNLQNNENKITEIQNSQHSYTENYVPPHYQYKYPHSPIMEQQEQNLSSPKNQNTEIQEWEEKLNRFTQSKHSNNKENHQSHHQPQTQPFQKSERFVELKVHTPRIETHRQETEQKDQYVNEMAHLDEGGIQQYIRAKYNIYGQESSRIQSESSSKNITAVSRNSKKIERNSYTTSQPYESQSYWKKEYINPEPSYKVESNYSRYDEEDSWKPKQLKKQFYQKENYYPSYNNYQYQSNNRASIQVATPQSYSYRNAVGQGAEDRYLKKQTEFARFKSGDTRYRNSDSSKIDERYNKYVLNKEHKTKKVTNNAHGTNSRDISLILAGDQSKISKISGISPKPALSQLDESTKRGINAFVSQPSAYYNNKKGVTYQKLRNLLWEQ